MDFTRTSAQLELGLCSRDSINTQLHFEVDSILKEFKHCLRALQSAFVSHTAELKVLERLYYKGKNQHHSSIFWRGLSDARRFGRRLNEVSENQTLKSFHQLFFGEEARYK
jgi:hypothetical protein